MGARTSRAPRPIALASPAVRRNGAETTLATRKPTSTAATNPARTAHASLRSKACRVAAATSAGATSAKPPVVVDRASTSCSAPNMTEPDTDRPSTA